MPRAGVPRENLDRTGAFPTDLGEKANPVEGIQAKAPTHPVPTVSLREKSLKPVARFRFAERLALGGHGKGEDRDAGARLVDVLTICESSTPPRLGNGADVPAREPNLERPHSWTSTVADFGTTTMR